MSMTVFVTNDMHEQIRQIKETHSVGQEAFVRAALSIVLHDETLKNRAIDQAAQDGNRGVGRFETEGVT